ncbi:MAG: uncharacterized protein KVP18_002319 [Porospora cf. gigantea A]|uniref:uncharacterized protein n=1 Tax=Porospora cf. gigantea A TaxID=2853593 RepID=UPI003559A796|nr:MAG: hypothetical protein KVP18_002319 [Porospora cf. gigantea A]
MLPRCLLQFTLFLAARVAPSWEAAEAVLAKDVPAMRRCNLHFLILVALEAFCFLFDPLFEAIDSLLPLSIYLELKVAFFVALSLPQLNLVDKVAVIGVDLYRSHGQKVVEELRIKLEPYERVVREQVAVWGTHVDKVLGSEQVQQAKAAVEAVTEKVVNAAAEATKSVESAGDKAEENKKNE